MKYLSTLLFCFQYLFIQAQFTELDQQSIDHADVLQDMEDVPEGFLETYLQIRSQPINLNKADIHQLRTIPYLKDQQVYDILQHREVHGDFLSVYELQSLPSIDSLLIENIKPYILIQDPNNELSKNWIKKIPQEGDHFLLLRYQQNFQKPKGATNAATENQKFIGDLSKQYIRFRSHQAHDYSIGITLEKDIGEALRWNPSAKHYGYDFISYHVQLMNKGILKNLIVGNFQAQFAQGILFGGLFGFGKGGETITATRKTNIGFLPYTSAYEAGSLHGIATTLSLSKTISCSVFASSSYRDASIEHLESNTIATSLPTTGLHRNFSELQRRKKLREANYGAIIQYQKKRVDVGLSFNHVQYNAAIQRDQTLYLTHAFRGEQFQNVGFHTSYGNRYGSFFHESAYTLSKGFASLTGLIMSINPRLDFAFLHRHYDPNFHTLFSNAFAESSNPQNERGMYWGWKYTHNRKWIVSGYSDFFKFPSLRYRSYNPSVGNEWLLRLAHTPNRKTSILLQLKREQKEQNNTEEYQTTYPSQTIIKYQSFIQLQHAIENRWRFKTRVQYHTTTINKQISEGIMLSQDVRFQFKNIELIARCALFDSDTYDSRIYAYEDHVWMAYALPSYDNQGIRQYIIVEYKWNKHITAWFRFAQTQYTQLTTVGSGVDATDGKTRSDLTFQLRYRF
jgi:hypothetical protein